MLPNFLVLGAQKSGTSWLAELLGEHPEVCMAPKEIHFFDKERAGYGKGQAWYEAHFAHCAKPGVKRIGEKTPDYFAPDLELAEDHRAGIHRRIHAMLPDARFIVVLREPAARAASAVTHLMRTGRVSPLRSVDEVLVGKSRHLAAPHGVLEYGFYQQHLDKYLELYPRDRFLVLVFEEDVVKRPAEALRRCCEFLGVDPSFRFERLDRKVNPMRGSRLGTAVASHLKLRRLGKWLDRRLPDDRRKPTAETMAELKRFYAPENEKLFRFLGRRIPSWE